MRIIAIVGLILLVPGLTTSADYRPPASSWHKPLPSFENRRLRLVQQTQAEAAKPEEIIERSAAAFRAMHELARYLGKQEMRLQLLDALLKDPEIPALAKKTLTDHQFARNAYKDDQAIARIYSIELLARKADLGDATVLLETAKELTLVLNKKEDLNKGELRDLEDLLYEYLRRVDLGDMSSTLKHFEYSPHLRATFMDAVAFALKGRVSDSQIEHMRSEL